MNLYKTKLAIAASLLVAGNVYAQSVPHVIVTAKPDIAEIEPSRILGWGRGRFDIYSRYGYESSG